VFAVILTPTRELAFQIRDQFLVFTGSTMNLRMSVLIGGIDMLKQSNELAEIPHIIIATPGRLVHHIEQDQVGLCEYLENLNFLVFDEADRLLTDESFQSDL
jgi:ATP-dependent RNA helicase DDX49/DBP8